MVAMVGSGGWAGLERNYTKRILVETERSVCIIISRGVALLCIYQNPQDDMVRNEFYFM